MSDLKVQGTEITETSIVESPRRYPDGDGVERVLVVRADLLEQYVAAVDPPYYPYDALSGTIAYLRQLPAPIDDLSASFGIRIYIDDMMKDPQVNSVVSILIMSLLCQGVTYQSPVKPDDPNYSFAEKILTFCKHCIENTKTPITQVRYELAEGMFVAGHKVGELLFTLADPIPGDYSGQQIVLSDVRTRAHESTAFVVDGYGKTVGLTYIKVGEAPLTLSTYIQQNGESAPRIIPRSKFWIPTHKPKNGSPLGTSGLRSVYTAWWKKQQINPQHMAYVARFAQPSLVANLGKAAKDIPIFDEAQSPAGSKSIVTATTQALAKVKGGAVASFIDTEVNMLEAKSDGAVIFSSYDHEDRQIAKGVLLQTLTTEQSSSMARAASAVHQDIFGILVQFMRDIMEETERRDVLQTLVRINYGEEAATLYTPHVSYGDVSVQDIPKYMAALAQLALAGGVHRTMWADIRTMMGLPPADPFEEKADLEEAQKIREAQAERLKSSITAPTASLPDSPSKNAVNTDPTGGKSGTSPNPNRSSNQ